jgi:hypothetical protein
MRSAGDAAATARGQDHPRALRTVGRAWSRVIWRCSQDRTPYNPARHRGLRQHITVLIPTQAGAASADVHPYAWRGAGLRPGARPARTGAGMNAAPAVTRPKAMTRLTMAGAPIPIGSRKTRDAAHDRGEVGVGDRRVLGGGRGADPVHRVRSLEARGAERLHLGLLGAVVDDARVVAGLGPTARASARCRRGCAPRSRACGSAACGARIL